MNLSRYRATFRRTVIPSYYSAKLHILFFVAFEAVALLLIGVRIDWSWTVPLVVLVSFLWATVSLYFLHRFLLHRRVPGFAWAHKLHHWHHTFYQAHQMQYDALDDVYMLLMPPWIQLLYFAVYLPSVVGVCTLALPEPLVIQVAWGLTLWYGLYEAVHWIEHLPDSHPLLRLSFFRSMKRHHVVHHHPRLKDSRNFGIVEPSQDFLWGTKA